MIQEPLTISRAEKADCDEIYTLYHSLIDDPYGTWNDEYPSKECVENDLAENIVYVMRDATGRIVSSIVDEQDIPVICYGLRTDFRGELFEGSRELLRWADTIEEIKTVCWCGRKATFNARVQNGHIVREGEQIMMGGNSTYVSLCRRHWKEGNLGSFRNLNLKD